MVRWYDFLAAFIVADLLLVSAFSVPFFGPIVAYALYEYGWSQIYCAWRHKQEYDE